MSQILLSKEGRLQDETSKDGQESRNDTDDDTAKDASDGDEENSNDDTTSDECESPAGASRPVVKTIRFTHTNTVSYQVSQLFL